MSQVVPFKGGAMMKPGALKQSFAKYQQDAPPVMTGDVLLRLLTDGDWVFGPNSEEVEEGSLWAVNPLSLEHGLCSWTDKKGEKNKLVGEVMVPHTSPPPLEDDMKDTGWPWKRQTAFRLVCVSGEDKGTEVLYKVNSVGGLRAHEQLVKDIMAQLEVDEEKIVPIIKLEQDHYPHKEWGRTYVPILTIVEWASLQDTEVDEEAIADKEPAKPKATRSRKGRKGKPEVEADDDDDGQTEEAVRKRNRKRKAKAVEPEPEPEEDDDDDFDPEEEYEEVDEEEDEPEPQPTRRRRRG